MLCLAVASCGAPLLAADGARDPIPVSAAALGSLLVQPFRDAPALVTALNDTRLSAEIAGVVSEISVAVGDRVTKGQVLARLDCEPHQIEVSRARAAVAAGSSNHDFSVLQLENARRLSEKRSISQEELDKRAADARTQRAELDRLQATLEAALRAERKCVLLAPLNAVVIERIASLGDYVMPGAPILRLLDDENLEVSAKVQEQDLPSLEQAAQVAFVNRERVHPVRLRTLLPLMETRLRTHEVRLTFSGEMAAPGTTGRLRWISGQPQVPAELLVQRGEQLGLFVREGERARFVPLPEARPGHPAPVALAPETEVILDGRFQLEDGDPVRLP
jgi:RND family efflux transporter MFP subunit